MTRRSRSRSPRSLTRPCSLCPGPLRRTTHVPEIRRLRRGTLTATNATSGNIHLAAGASEPTGTSNATVQASDGNLNNQKSFIVTVTPTNRAPVLAQPSNMTVSEGATADQALSATDPDGDPL